MNRSDLSPRRRLRRALLAAAAAVAGASLAVAVASAGAAQTLPPGATLVASVLIPNDGPVTYGLGSVWAVDRENGAIHNGQPMGRLYRIDPRTTRVTGLIPHVTGGSASVGSGSVWLASFVLNRVLRVDPASHHVTWITTGAEPLDVLALPGGIWVSNHHDGDVVVVDPATNAVTTSVPVFRKGPDGPQALASDGTSVWVAIPGADLTESAIVRINAATRTVTGTVLGLPDGPCGGVVATTAKVWATASDCDGTGVMQVDPATNGLVDYFHTAGLPGDALFAFGSLWIVTRSPDQLVRVDPATDQIVGAQPLPATPWNLTTDGHRLWVRVQGAVLNLSPQ
jgi:YVTN family beta-propeller protein